MGGRDEKSDFALVVMWARVKVVSACVYVEQGVVGGGGAVRCGCGAVRCGAGGLVLAAAASGRRRRREENGGRDTREFEFAAKRKRNVTVTEQ